MDEIKVTIDAIEFYVNRLQNLLKFLKDEGNSIDDELDAIREVQYVADNLRKEMQRRLLKSSKQWKAARQ